MAEVFFLTKRGWGANETFEIFGALPGDHIQLQKLNRKKAKLLSIEKPSPDRITPRCSHVGTCGGCAFQALSYKKQLEHKQTQIQKLFDHPVLPIIACDSPYEMRNKMEFSFSQDKAENHYLGLHMPAAKGRVLNIEHCHLVSPWFSETLSKVRVWWKTTPLKAFRPHKGTGHLRTLTIREGKRTGQKMVILTIDGNARSDITQDLLSSFKSLFSPDTALFLHIHQAIPKKPTQLFEMHLQGPDHICEELHLQDRILKFTISPSSFFQPNTVQAEKLYGAALDLIEKPVNGPILDLYAGSASLGILFSPHAPHITSIEINPYSACDAEQNLLLNNTKNLTFIRGDVEKHLPTLPQNPALAIIDPPRAGLGPKSCAHLLALKPQKILYISCNPSTQAEDLQNLPGYQIAAIQPVDQFPHTPHLENIILLKQKLT